jgi:hypothetical protein
MAKVSALPTLDATNYQRSVLHAEDQLWVDKNCYVDVWIEVIHALGLEPRAVMPFVATMDFEVDQWTFYKPPHDELRDLYGIDVNELNVWQPLLEHAQEHIAAGRMISTEADAWWLPDTSGTDYRTNHVKTTIALAELDVENQRLGYFHSAGYFMLEGEDFAQTFRLNATPNADVLPLFAESVRVDRLTRKPARELTELSLALWRKHLSRLPQSNPVERYKRRFEQQLSVMHARGLAYYHAWAFATTRQVGSGFELLARNLEWLEQNGVDGLNEARAAFEAIAATSKTFILKGARAVNAKRQFDGSEMFSEMSTAWQRGVDVLSSHSAI